MGRLAVISVVALGLLFLSFDLGLGVMAGLASFEFLLLVNVARSMFKIGRGSVADMLDAATAVVAPLDETGGRLTGPASCRTSSWPPTSRSVSTSRRSRLSTSTPCGPPSWPAIVVCARASTLRRQVTSGVPGKLQTALEMGVERPDQQVEARSGRPGHGRSRWPSPCSSSSSSATWFEVVGLGGRLRVAAGPPTADINLPWPWPLFVIVLVHMASIRARGLSGYVKHYCTQPFPLFLLPFNIFINVVEEIAKPITLALRLFGNLFSGT